MNRTECNSIEYNSPIRSLPGVGPKRAEAFVRLGARCVGDLPEIYPRAYENRGDIYPIAAADGNGKRAYLLTVATEPRRTDIRRGMTLVKFRAYDESGSCEIIYFNQNYMKDFFSLGETYRFFGKAEKKGSKISLTNPAAELYSEERPLPPLVPVYPLTEGLSQNILAKHINFAIEALSTKPSPDFIPTDIAIREGLCTHPFAIKNIHNPVDYKSLSAAKKRLAFEEFFLFAIGLGLNREQNKKSGATPCKKADTSPLLNQLPYKLTGAQERAIAEIFDDMAKDTPMCRILVGDVGSGKTICAAAAIFGAVVDGHQAALMVPTEILAKQHYEELSTLFERLGYSCRLLCGSTKASEKKKIYESIKSENTDVRTDILIGTHALISDKVEFSDLALVVTDEQHRFGVGQRASLTGKGYSPHMLVMSATPIPRTLALSFFGDLDMSLIDELPEGRQRVDTFAVDESYRDRLNAFIRKNVAEGGQVYIVCPAIEEAEDCGEVLLDEIDEDGIIKYEEKPPLKAAVPYAEEIARIFSDIPTAFVHGRMKPSEKDEIMGRFSRGEIKILVSTVVIEVGVNVPNASLMIVENAERFGLSQLHQLRGRVGRGRRKSYCVLVSDAKGENARERLQIMKSTSSGFVIAEKDLEMRGSGDFLGMGGGSIRQSGGMKFKIADPAGDRELMCAAFSSAREILSKDSELRGYPALREAVSSLFDGAYEKGIIS